MSKEVFPFETFPIKVSPELREKVEARTAKFVDMVDNGEAPQYQDFVDALFNHMNDTESCLAHAAIGLAGEGGEVLDCMKRNFIYGKELNVENLIEELGDTIFYVCQILNMLNMDLDDIMAHNMEKLMKRYPEGKYSNFHANARLDKEGE
jgi:NTP pyrophosphatase (non-canonical NTP hydrolase)